VERHAGGTDGGITDLAGSDFQSVENAGGTWPVIDRGNALPQKITSFCIIAILRGIHQRTAIDCDELEIVKTEKISGHSGKS